MGKPNPDQVKLASILNVDVTLDTEFVAAARLEDAVSPAIHPSGEPRNATERQIAFGRSLGLDLNNDSFRVASARIDEELRNRNHAALNALQLKPGDRVIKRHRIEIDGQVHDLDQEYVVSSVDDNLRVWFKGGNGLGAWPTQLEKVNTHLG